MELGIYPSWCSINPLMRRRMSPGSMAEACSFQREKHIEPDLSATRHFLTVLPSFVRLVVPKKNRKHYLNGIVVVGGANIPLCKSRDYTTLSPTIISQSLHRHYSTKTTKFSPLSLQKRSPLVKNVTQSYSRALSDIRQWGKSLN